MSFITFIAYKFLDSGITRGANWGRINTLFSYLKTRFSAEIWAKNVYFFGKKAVKLRSIAQTPIGLQWLNSAPRPPRCDTPTY